jgi:CheY-like chemotaxis protein/HPt (histidine-containing phosphotransfer) domain-containing protein
MTGTESAGADQNEFMQQLEVEFRDSASDLLSQVDTVLDAGRDAGNIPADQRDSIYRIAHSMKGLAAGFGYSLTSVVAHRMEDYLSDVKELVEKHIADIQIFVDTLGDLVDGSVKERNVNVSEFVRGLPSRPSDFGEISAQDIEVLVVMPDDALSRHVMRELQACGYRVTREGNSFKAIEIASMTKPDLVIVTGMLDMLSGIDVTSAFRAMPSTKDIPVALITADSREEAMSHGLPEAVPVIRKGTEFGDDLTEALTATGIL